MSSGKDSMLGNANYYAGVVAAAKRGCEEAAQALTSPQSMVSENWQGASGTAMVSALERIKAEIEALGIQLSSLESQMRAHARSIYNNWPEETEEA